MSKKKTRPSDNHANQQNPNNPARKAAKDNRGNQLNPNHKKTKG
jgi:hypothetical protein